jgi:ABC-type antimicrobial peptide transport system permease subunit
MPNHLKVIITSILLLLTACAQVPKEAIELSATVGRDLAEIRKSHIALVDLYYDHLFDDINQFVDDVYLPFQVQQTLSDPELKKELLKAIEAASRDDATGTTQKEAMEIIESFLVGINDEVDSFKEEQLKPVKEQYHNLVTNLNQAYDQIYYANSVVTGHLASVRKVHDTQDEILAKLSLSNFKTTVGKKLADLSDNIDNLTKKAKEKSQSIEEIIAEFKELVGSKK